MTFATNRRSINRHDQDESELDIEDAPRSIESSAIVDNGNNNNKLSRKRRSLDETPSLMMSKINGAALVATNEAGALHRRVKRHSKYIGPVYTYVKTDKHARFKWGVKHKVGKHHG